MMWFYQQSTGDLKHNDSFVGMGYSGTAAGRDNPAMQDVHNVGPIPQGDYIIGAPYHHPQLGPCVMNLDPLSDTQTFGRDAFRIHGDNVAHDASHGCIIMGPSIRESIAQSGDVNLTVIE